MKRTKALRIPGFLTALILALNLGCADDPTSPAVSLGPSGLPGTWAYSSASPKIAITTNASQTAVNPCVEGAGAIAVSGVVNAQLTYLLTATIGSIPVTVVSNEIGAGYLYQTYPCYTLSLMNIGFNVGGGSLSVKQNDSTESTFEGAVTFTYDSAAHRLVVNQSQLTNSAVGNVTISGTLTARTFPLVANVPSEVSVPMELFSLTGSATLALNADSTFSENSALGGDTLSATGTWLADEDSLEFAGTSGALLGTNRFAYVVTSTALSLSMTSPACDGQIGTSSLSCMEALRMAFGLKSGTLADAQRKVTLNFARTVTKRAAGPAAPLQ